MSEKTYDVAVIGGGMGGLGGALTLARSRRSVVVIDDGRPRNAPAAGVHTYPGAEGTPPGELLARTRDEVRQYGGEFVTGTVERAERAPTRDTDDPTSGGPASRDAGGEAASGGPASGEAEAAADSRFRLTLHDGSALVADRLLIASGVVDELPDLPGLAERWGKDALHCPYCHGWEVRDRPIAVLGTGPIAVHQALLWRQWSDDVTLLLHTAPAPTAEQREQLAARRIAVVDEKVTGVLVESDRMSGVTLASGRTVPCEALVVGARTEAQAGFLADLGLEPVPQERDGYVYGTALKTDQFGATDVPGVWAVGNVAMPFENVIGSASAGVHAGAMINMDLVHRDVRNAAA